MVWLQWGVFGCHHFLVKLFHAVRLEWWPFGQHLVEYTPYRPDVALLIIWLVFPNFRACIVWGTCLCVQHSSLENFRNVEIPQLGFAFAREENVGAFEVSMTYL